MKEKIIEEFCESSDGQSWFMKLVVAILKAAVIELMDKFHEMWYSQK